MTMMHKPLSSEPCTNRDDHTYIEFQVFLLPSREIDGSSIVLEMLEDMLRLLVRRNAKMNFVSWFGGERRDPLTSPRSWLI